MAHPVHFFGQSMVSAAIYYVIEALIWIIIIDAILTFIPSLDRRNPFVMLLRNITEPIYRRVRKIIPSVRLGDAALDLSPIIIIVGLQLIRWILLSII